MLRPCALPASGFVTLTSVSLRHSATRFSGTFKLGAQTRPRTTLYPPLNNPLYNATEIAAEMQKRSGRTWQGSTKRGRRATKVEVIDGSAEHVLDVEAETLLERLKVEGHDGPAQNGGSPPEGPLSSELGPPSASSPLEPGTELELEIHELSSTGDGLAYSPDKSTRVIYVVPFSVPGDKVLAKWYPQRLTNRPWRKVDLVRILSPAPTRQGTTPQCSYFGTCSGCQLQMLPYAAQLAHKKTIIEKAFKHFSNLDPSLIPPVDDMIGSPVQYGYRTKLTPHFTGPAKGQAWTNTDDPPPFGFLQKNRSHVIVDIEQCPIGTEILNKGLKIERAKMSASFWKKDAGATVLLRENTRRELLKKSTKIKASPDSAQGNEPPSAVGTIGTQGLSSLPLEYPGPPLSTTYSSLDDNPQIQYTYPLFSDTKSYSADNAAFATEHIGPYTFTTGTNSFFQNNNAILPKFLAYIREHIVPQNKSPAITGEAETLTYAPKIRYLLDAYCGSGLFSIALASEFSSVLGIDIDARGIECARENARINTRASPSSTTPSARPSSSSQTGNLGFIAASAEAIFDDVPFPPTQTLCIIDPPRKGASIDFLKQLCRFGPRRVAYVSCNVHTQARDVGMLVHGFQEQNGNQIRRVGWRYEIERLGGFDFFPQTGHVEGVCFLNRVEE